MNRDCVQHLPYDVLDNVFLELSFRERIRCTGVSHAWRIFLLTSPHVLWHDLSDIHCDLDMNLAAYMRWFSGRHVRRVQLAEYSSAEGQQRAMAFLAKHGCSSIESMDMSCRAQAIVPHIISVLGSGATGAASRLTQLTMRCALNDANMAGAVLSACPQLRIFRYHQATSGSIALTQPLPRSPLAHLVEMVLDTPLSKADAAHIVLQIPRIVRLRLQLDGRAPQYDDDDDGIILGLMDAHCPRLAQLQLGTCISAMSSSFASITTTDTRGGGLHELSLADRVLLGGEQRLVALLRKHHASLQVLHIRSSYTSLTTTRCLAPLGCPQLRDLRLSLACQPDPLCALIRSAPRLETVQLHFPDNHAMVADTVLAALGDLPHLRVLGLQGSCRRAFTSPECLLHWVRHGRFARIEKLHLPGVDALTDTVLDAITDRMARQLVSLDMQHATHISEYALRRFIDHVAAAPAMAPGYNTSRALVWLNVSQCTHITSTLAQYACDRLGPFVKVYA